MSDPGPTTEPQRRDPVEVMPYDPSWPTRFASESGRMAVALAPWLVGPIEHIGSTAVAGLPAKPIIDMLARIDDYDRVEGMVAALAAIGWVYAPEPGDRQRRTWSFCTPDPAWRTHHLHVVEQRSPHWRTWLAFRDHLRSHPADAAEYAMIKTGLASAHRHDRPAYRAGKAPFIADLLRRITPSSP